MAMMMMMMTTEDVHEDVAVMYDVGDDNSDYDDF